MTDTNTYQAQANELSQNYGQSRTICAVRWMQVSSKIIS